MEYEFWYPSAGHNRSRLRETDLLNKDGTMHVIAPAEFIKINFIVEDKKRYNLPDHLFHIEE